MSSDTRRILYWAIAIVGVLLIIAPFVLGYDDIDEALWASIILGGIIALSMIYKALVRDDSTWEFWLAGIAGVAAIVAPFVLGYDNDDSSLWSSIVLGVLAVLGAGYLALIGRPRTT